VAEEEADEDEEGVGDGIAQHSLHCKQAGRWTSTASSARMRLVATRP
jgi:hypothetical protein